MSSEPPRRDDESSRATRPLVFFAILGGVGLLLGAMIGYPCAMMLNH